MQTMLMPDYIIRQAQEILAETVDINQFHLNEVMPLMEELRAVKASEVAENEESTVESKSAAPSALDKFALNRSAVSESSRKLLQQYALNAKSAAEFAEDRSDREYHYHTASVFLDILKAANGLSQKLERERNECRHGALINSPLYRNLIHEHISAGVGIEDHYILNGAEELGKGTYGKVIEAVHRGSGKRFACKIINISRIEPRQIFKLNAEVSAMRIATGHSHIVSLREVFYSPNFVFLVMDLCSGGELFNMVTDESKRCKSEPEIAQMLSDMFGAVAFLHANKIVHRDIKLENWMFSEAGSLESLKLIDFGLSKYLSNNGEGMYQAVGSAYYVAPEVLLGSYNKSCDVWSMGVIAYMMLSGTPPFFGRNDVEVRAKIIEGKYEMPPELFGNASAHSLDFVRRLLVKDPSTRFTAAEAMNHPFLKLLVAKPLPSGPPQLKKSQLINSMRSFRRFSNMKRLILSVATRLGNSYLLAPDGLKGSFRALAGPTGIVLLADLDRALKGYASTREIEELFDACTTFGTNGMSFSEFLASTSWPTLQTKIDDSLLRDIFQVLDIQNRGFLSAEGLQKVLGNNCTLSTAESMMKEADLEDTKALYFASFIRFWRANGAQKKKRSRRNFSLFKKHLTKK